MFATGSCLLLLIWFSHTVSAADGKAPHVLFILVDDLGWGDVGFHRDMSDAKTRQEIQTPHMDRLAQQGVILDRHYVHSSCTGTRVALQSGRLPVHVQTSLKLVEDPSSGMPRNLTGLAEQMQPAGYRSHYVGKWDVGMATPKHTPHGRGYETSLHYFEHKNDFWTQQCMQSICCPTFGSREPNVTATESRQTPQSASIPTNKNYNLSLVDLWDTKQPARSWNGTDYEEFIFLRRMKQIIRQHNKEEPLFMFYAPHVAHCPLQVPKEYLDRFDSNAFANDTEYCQAQTPTIFPPNQTQPNKYSCRRQYHAMVTLLDDVIGQLVVEFKAQGLWEDTLLVFTSDNGGPIKMQESGSTNFDLRGGKYSDWEGGVRAVAFVSGGFVPVERRGSIVTQPIHIADWYATLPAIAGIPKESLLPDIDSNPVPPVDAVNVWPLIAGQVEQSPRYEIPLSVHSLIQGDYKLIWKEVVQQSGWTGPFSPNTTTKYNAATDASINCEEGCLFHVGRDHGEHVDLAQEEPVRLQAMKKRLVELREGFYNNDDRGVDSCPPDIDMPCACWMAINYYGGYMGPYQEVNMTDPTLVQRF